MELPLVSIVIPAYNASRWLSDCIESALSLAYRPIEIVVYDDCSTDDTATIAESYAQQGIRLIKGVTNLGRYGGLSAAMPNAAGSLVLKLDADDIVGINYLDELVPVMVENHNVAFATCDFVLIDVDGVELRTERRVSPLGVQSGRKEFVRYLRANRARGTCVLIRRSFLDMVGGFDGRFVYNGDWWLFLKLLAVGDVYYSSQVLAKYRVHKVGKSRRPIWEAEDHLQAWSLLPMIWPQDIPGKERHIQRARRRFSRVLLEFSLFETQPEDKQELLDLVLKTDDSRMSRLLVEIAHSPFYSVLAWPRRLQVGLAQTVKGAMVQLRAARGFITTTRHGLRRSQ